MANEAQVKIGELLAINLAMDGELVAAAKIQDAVAIATLERPGNESTERQRQFATSLGIVVDGDSTRVASARIQEALRTRNESAVHSLKLKPGMLVVLESKVVMDGRTRTLREGAVIFSIQNGGFIYFKGG